MMFAHRSPRARVISVCLGAALSLSAACSDDATPKKTPSADMQSGVDMTQPKDMRQDVIDLGPEDMPTIKADMKEDMTQPSKDMSGMQDMGADAGEDMAAMEDMGAADMMMWPDMMDAACTFPTTDPNCPMGPYGPGAYVTKFQIVEDTTCCRDFSGDGSPDNFVGSTLIRTAKTAFMQDVNANVAKAIELGLTVYLFEFKDLGDVRYDRSLSIDVLTGTDDDLDLTNNTAGNGAFVVSPRSFDFAGQPRSYFHQAQLYNGKLFASQGRFEVTFPGLISGVELILADVELRADVMPTSTLGAGGGVGLGNGELSGAMLREPLINSMNSLARSCACIGRDIFSYQAATNTYKCELNASACETDARCKDVGDKTLCSTLAFLSRSVDIDSDGDGKRDAYSFGAKLEAVPTVLKSTP